MDTYEKSLLKWGSVLAVIAILIMATISYKTRPLMPTPVPDAKFDTLIAPAIDTTDLLPESIINT